MLNKSPKLFRPVDVDVLVEGNGGVGKESSAGVFLRELRVDERPRKVNLERDGEDLEDDAVEPFRNKGVPGRPRLEDVFIKALGEEGACVGEGNGDWKPSGVISSEDCEVRAARAESDEGAVDNLVTESECEASGCAFFCGRCLRSNNGAGFLRRGRRKKVVVVCTVCVVVVVVA